MKTPISVIEDITAQIYEGKTLLEMIYANSAEDEKTDSALACLIRSFDKAIETANEYVMEYSAPPPAGKGRE